VRAARAYHALLTRRLWSQERGSQSLPFHIAFVALFLVGTKLVIRRFRYPTYVAFCVSLAISHLCSVSRIALGGFFFALLVDTKLVIRRFRHPAYVAFVSLRPFSICSVSRIALGSFLVPQSWHLEDPASTFGRAVTAHPRPQAPSSSPQTLPSLSPSASLVQIFFFSAFGRLGCR
jgi:hypothetical protein